MTVLCDLDIIPEGGAKGLRVQSHQLVAVKKDGQVYVYVNSCPHIGITLEFQPDQFLDLDNRYIQCANHGALFEIENGDCISGPCSGKALKPVPVTIEGNQVIINGEIPAPF